MDAEGIKIGKMPSAMMDDDACSESNSFAFLLKAVVVESHVKGERILPGHEPIHECDACLDEELWQCHCQFFDPEDGSDCPFVIISNQL